MKKMVKLAPSKHPEKEAKQFGIVALVCGILSLFIWFFGIAALGAGVRAAILSNRVKNKKYMIFSVVGIILGLVALAYYYLTK